MPTATKAKPKNPRGLQDIPFPLPEVSAAEKRRAKTLLTALEKAYPDANCALNYTTPHELLLATILSAQCTDVAVNKATPALFAKYPDPGAFAKATPKQLEPYVKSLGFFRNKAKSLHLSMKTIVEKHDSQVPQTMEDLIALQGVARKTANVVLGNAFNINVGVVVDTHVQRLSYRMGLVDEGQTVQAIERKLMVLFPRDKWCVLSHLLIAHGRNACKARGNRCEDDPICNRFGINCPVG